MAGLLDLLNTDGDKQGLLGLYIGAAAGPRAQPASFMQRLLEGMQGARGAVQQDEDRKQRAAMQALQMQMQQAQMGEIQAQARQRAAQAQEMQRKAAEQERVQRLLQSSFSPVSGATANAASGVTGPRPEALNAVGQMPPVNYQALMAQGVPADLVKSLAEARNYGRDKVARTVDGRDAQGRPVTFQQDDYGGTVGAPIQQWKAPVMSDTGGTINALDPVTLNLLQQFKKTQSPDSQASNKLGWANYGLARDRQAQEASAGQLIETPNGYVRVGKDNRTTPIFAPGGQMQPLLGKGSGMTEDQGKATGWLVQAQNAYKNMQESGFDATGNPKSAAYPGVNDALARIPGAAPFANAMRSPDRQKFIQSSQSLSEALLRAATGAGINKEEAAQKVQELVPLFGEDEATTKQKMAAIPLYIESLKVRSGPGAAKAAGIGTAQQPSIKFLGFE